MTHERFNEELIKVLKEKSVSELIRIPGIYEILSEEFNNEVLKRIGISDIMDKKLSEKDLEGYPPTWSKSLKKMKWQLDRLLEFYKKDTSKDYDWSDSDPFGYSIIDSLSTAIARRTSDDLPYTECCPHCEAEVDTSELKGLCPLCGGELIVCSVCLRPDLTGEEGSCTGCEHGSRMLLEKEEK